MAAKRRAAALAIDKPKIIAPASVEKWCGDCNTHHPVAAFLRSSFTADGLNDICLASVRRTAERNRLTREMRLQELEAKRSPAAMLSGVQDRQTA